MSSSFGGWLIAILALLAGLLGWRMLRGRQAAATATPTVEGAPVAGNAEVSAPATAVVDQERPAAVVDQVAVPAAVTDEPTPAEYEAPPAAATLAAGATTVPDTDPKPAEQPQRVEAAEPTPADVDATPVAAAEPIVEAEPTRVEEVETPVVAEVEAEPAEPPATVAAEAESVEVGEVAVPAPRAAVEDQAPATTAAGNGAAPSAADDFRRIQGIGPKMAAALQSAGIRTYQQLAELDEPALREIIKAAGLRATSTLATWPQQAKLLAGAYADADRVLPVGADERA